MQVKQLLSLVQEVSGTVRTNIGPAYRYLLQGPRAAIVSTTIALLVVLLTGTAFRPVACTLFLGAIILSAYHGGMLSGVLAIVLSAFFIGGLHLFPSPQSVGFVEASAGIILLALAGLLACFLANECKTVARKLDEQRRNLAHAKEGLIVLDDMLRVKHINQAAETLTGWTEEDALNRPLEAVAGLVEQQQSGQSAPMPWTTLLEKNNGKMSGSGVLVTRDSSEKYVDYWVELVANADGGKDACFYFHDISERRDSEERNRRLLEQHQRLADCIPVPFFFLDQGNRCTLQNKGWQDIAGGEPDERIVHTVSGKLNFADPQFVANWSKALRERTKYVTECQLRGSGAVPVRQFCFDSIPLRGERGESLGQLCMLLDLTQTKQTEADLAKKQQELLNLQNLLHQSETEANEHVVALEKAREVLQQELAKAQEMANAALHDADQLRGQHGNFDAEIRKLQEQGASFRRQIEELTAEAANAKHAATRSALHRDHVQSSLRAGTIFWEKKKKPLIDDAARALLEVPDNFTGAWSECLQILDAAGEHAVDDDASPFALAEQRAAFQDVEVTVHTQSGASRLLRTTGNLLRDEQGREHGYLMTLHEIAQVENAGDDAELLNQQLHDALQALENEKNAAASRSELHDRQLQDALRSLAQEKSAAAELAELHALELQDALQALAHEKTLTARQGERIHELMAECADWEGKLTEALARVRTLEAAIAERDTAARIVPERMPAASEPVVDRAVAFARCVSDQIGELTRQLCKQVEDVRADDFRKNGKLRIQHLNVLADSLRSTLHVPERSTLRPEPVEISQLVNRVVRTWQRLLHAGARQLVVALPAGPAWTVGSSELLCLATEILVDIACHNSDAGAYIDLSLAKDEVTIVLSVKDKSGGFTGQELDFLRDGVVPTGSASAALDALRIGIAFVTALAELHHGDLEVQSGGRGKGCAFLLRLPRHTPDEMPLRSAPMAEMVVS